MRRLVIDQAPHFFLPSSLCVYNKWDRFSSELAIEFAGRRSSVLCLPHRVMAFFRKIVQSRVCLKRMFVFSAVRANLQLHSSGRFLAALLPDQLLSKAAAGCTKPGKLGALLRLERLYHATISDWKRQCDRGLLDGNAPPKPSPKPDAAAKRIAQLERENRRLTVQLEQAKTILSVQKNSPNFLGENSRKTIICDRPGRYNGRRPRCQTRQSSQRGSRSNL